MYVTYYIWLSIIIILYIKIIDNLIKFKETKLGLISFLPNQISFIINLILLYIIKINITVK